MVIVLYSLSAFAQKGTIKGAIVGGANIAFPVGPDVKEQKVDLNKPPAGGTASGGFYPRIGFHLGGTVNYFVTDKIAIGSGLIYSQRGAVQKSKRELPNSYKYDRTFKANIDYLDIPVAGQFHLSDNFYIGAGPEICIKMGSKSISKGTDAYYGSSSSITTYNTNNGGIDFLKGVIFGFQLGCGIKGKKVGFNFNISKTGNPAIPEAGSGYMFPNLTLQAGLIYSFDFKKSE